MVEMFQLNLLLQDLPNLTIARWMIQPLLAVSAFWITSRVYIIIITCFPGNSPFTSFNLEEGVHTVRVKTQKCGAGDRRLSFKFTVCYK